MNSHSSVKLKSQMFETAPKSVTSSPVISSKRIEAKLSSPSEDSRRILELELKLDKQTKQIQSDALKIKQLELESRTSEARYSNLVASLREIGLEAEDILQHGGQKPKKRGSFLSHSEISNAINDSNTSPVSSASSSSSHGIQQETLSLQERQEIDSLREENQRLLATNQILSKANDQLKMKLDEATTKLKSTQSLLDEATQRAGNLESQANEQITLTNSRSFDADR